MGWVWFGFVGFGLCEFPIILSLSKDRLSPNGSSFVLCDSKHTRYPVRTELVEVPVHPEPVEGTELVEVPVHPEPVEGTELVEVPVHPEPVEGTELVEVPVHPEPVLRQAQDDRKFL
jgi:hypothetical protein